MHGEKISRYSKYFHQYATVAPTNVAYGKCCDMINQLEYFITNADNVINEEGELSETTLERGYKMRYINKETTTANNIHLQFVLAKFYHRSKLINLLNSPNLV